MTFCLISSHAFGLPSNLVTNSLSYTNADGGFVQVSDQQILVKSNKLILVLDKDTGGILGLINILTGQELHIRNSSMFWLIETNDEWISNEELPMNFKHDNKWLLLRWSSEDIEIRINITVNVEDDILIYSTVRNYNSNRSLIRLFIPYIGGVEFLGKENIKDYLAVPDGEGYEIEDAVNSIREHEASFQYPCSLSMQFLLLYEKGVGGFYIGIHDNTGRFKGLELFKWFTESGIEISWYHFVDKVKPGNSLILEYPIVISAFKGYDWHEGAEIYKRWALKQWFISKGFIKYRLDVPEWLKNLDITWRGHSYGIDDESKTKEVKLIGEKLSDIPIYAHEVQNLLPGLSILLTQWTGWDNEGFDKGYPEYYPPVEGEDILKKSIEQVHKMGLRIGLYFNGLLVDMETNTFKDNEDKMCINYYSGEYDVWDLHDGLVKAAVVDVSTDWWLREVINFSMIAVTQYDVDEVYLDCLSAASPLLCASGVNPIFRGGNTWSQSVMNIFREVRSNIKKVKPDVILSTEGLNELYIPFIDLFKGSGVSMDFGYGLPKGRGIPLFSYVYHGYFLTNGDHDAPPDGSQINKYTVSEDLLRGHILAAFTGKRPSISNIGVNEISYLRNSAIFRRTFKEFLVFGQMIPPPLIKGVSRHVFPAPYYEKNEVIADDVSIAAYKQIDTDAVLIIISNRVNKLKHITLHNINRTNVKIKENRALIFDGRWHELSLDLDRGYFDLRIMPNTNIAIILNPKEANIPINTLTIKYTTTKTVPATLSKTVAKTIEKISTTTSKKKIVKTIAEVTSTIIQQTSSVTREVSMWNQAIYLLIGVAIGVAATMAFSTLSRRRAKHPSRQA